MGDYIFWLLAAAACGLIGWQWQRRRAARRDSDEPAPGAVAEDAERAAQDEQAAQERHAAEAQRQEAERVEAERTEAQRVEAERLEAERLAAQRAEAERLAAERAEAQRVEAERLEAERLAAQQAEAERLAAELAEAQRVEAERLEAERLAAQRAEAERLAAQRAEAERLAAERAEVERVEAERLEAKRLAEQRAEAERLAAAPPASRPVKAAAQTLVLVADDSKVVRVKTGRLLAQHQYQVAYAVDGLDAVQQMQAQLPDVLITDVEMPGMDGFELTRHLRAQSQTAQLPVIMITAADDRHREQADAAGVSVLLGKPYPEDALIAHIRQALGQDGTAAPAGSSAIDALA